MLNDKTQSDIRAHAVAAFPNECCGVVVIVNGKERYWPCANTADKPNKTFVLSPADYAHAEDLGEIVAIVHSHPNILAVPSQADKVMCEASGLRWYIVHVSVADGTEQVVATDINAFDPEGYEAPLVGRTFSHGVLDCYTLCRDYYKREMGIELPDFPRQDDWWHKGENLYFDHFAEAGFEPIKGPIQIGDGILIQLRATTANHAAVYIGDGLIMHHVAGRLSSRDVYDGYWQENTRMIVRHKDAKR